MDFLIKIKFTDFLSKIHPQNLFISLYSPIWKSWHHIFWYCTGFPPRMWHTPPLTPDVTVGTQRAPVWRAFESHNILYFSKCSQSQAFYVKNYGEKIGNPKTTIIFVEPFPYNNNKKTKNKLGQSCAKLISSWDRLATSALNSLCSWQREGFQKKRGTPPPPPSRFVLWSSCPETHCVWYQKFQAQILADLEHFHWQPSWSPRNPMILPIMCVCGWEEEGGGS